jgi:hypothetical protein
VKGKRLKAKGGKVRRWETREVGIGNAECGKLKLKA